MTFPVTAPDMAAAAASSHSLVSPRSVPNATILVVDDERLVRQASRGSLEGLGFKVLEAEHGAHALDIMKNDVRAQLKAHVRGWLSKPFGEKELADALRSIGLIA